MGNDIIDLTDEFNDILKEYLVEFTEDFTAVNVVDLDAWAMVDILRSVEILTQVLILRSRPPYVQGPEGYADLISFDHSEAARNEADNFLTFDEYVEWLEADEGPKE